jgi:beta-glucosidase
MFYPAADKDEKAAALGMEYLKMFLDPIFKGRYPKAVEGMIRGRTKGFLEDDLKIISKPMDFLGVNNYSRSLVKKTLLPIPGFKWTKPDYPGVRFTEMNWEVYPQGIYDLLMWIRKEYKNPAVYITENGAAFKDVPAGNRVHDPERTDFLAQYLAMVNRAIRDGCDIRGYFVWSFLDNFEWAYGFTRRFGLVYTDYKTCKRIVKDSGNWYGKVCRENQFILK